MNCIIALDEILAEEGGMRINKAINDYLLGRMKEFNEWGQCVVLNVLHRYKPESEEEYYEAMVFIYLFIYFFNPQKFNFSNKMSKKNVLDDRLKHSNSGVVFATIKIFLKFAEDLPHIAEDIYFRVKGWNNPN